MSESRFTFVTLIIVVAISGMTQGLTLPLLSVLLEQQGVSSLANGFNATALYLGVLLISPLLEIPLRRIGYRNTIILGLSIVAVSTLLLPLFQGLLIWFSLRLILGIGDSMLHFASQMWVTTVAPAVHRGRDLSIYGFAYGTGFGIGPLGMLLLSYGTWTPFAALFLFYLIAFFMLNRLTNDFPQPMTSTVNTKNRYSDVIRLGWLALIPPLLYGYLEATLNVNFPVYAVRNGISTEWISIILPSFVVGGLALQLPIGRWSDQFGRKKVMMYCSLIGGTAFILFPMAGSDVWLMMLLLAIAGAAVGSFYSLSLAFSADILPAVMVPTAGIIATMNFSVASMIAPNINGFIIGNLWPGTMFIVLGFMFFAFFASGMIQNRANRQFSGS